MKKVVIMGAGPAGLSAAYELEKNSTDTVILESEGEVGGISKTIKYKGYYFDLGGHRFFTKLDEVNRVWREVLGDDFRRTPRLSRIYYNNKFFNYPLTPLNALLGVGIRDTVVIMLSYMKSIIMPYKNEQTFEEWVSNRFGKKLYSIFFKTYTEKVWGIPCSKIQAEWAAQRIKGLSLKTAVINALFKMKKQKVKTLIDQFDYPLFGPGMMYGNMGKKIEAMGGGILLNSKVTKVVHDNNLVTAVEYTDAEGNTKKLGGTDFISSLPVTELIHIMSPQPDSSILNAAGSLDYRSMITVDVIVNKNDLFPDNWIYIHSPGVKLGRIQNFKNWSSHMVPDTEKTALGLEYFCTEGDELWNMSDRELFELAVLELEKIKICKASEVEDYTVIKVPKAYPVYSVGYKKSVEIMESYLRSFRNLQLIGRYGLFKYNNMDHSILTGLYAAKNICMGRYCYDTWSVNTDDEYQEEKKLA